MFIALTSQTLIALNLLFTHMSHYCYYSASVYILGLQEMNDSTHDFELQNFTYRNSSVASKIFSYLEQTNFPGITVRKNYLLRVFHLKLKLNCISCSGKCKI